MRTHLAQAGLRPNMNHWLHHEVDDELAQQPVVSTSANLCAWWPVFKSNLSATTAFRNQAARCHHLALGPRAHTPHVTLHFIPAASPAPCQAAALPALVAAKLAIVLAKQGDATDVAHTCHVTWLLAGEHPSPAMAALMIRLGLRLMSRPSAIQWASWSLPQTSCRI